MASPFSIFRKYQATLLAVFGVALMIAFVVFPAIQQMQQLGGGRHGSRPVVMTWAGGDVTGDELQTTGRVNNWTMQFLGRLQQQARKDDPDANLSRGMGAVNMLRDTSPSGVVRTMLLSRKAADAGVVVSDEAVYRFLMQFTDDVLDKQDIDDVYQIWVAERQKANAPAPPKQSIIDALRTVLMAFEMDKMARAGLEVTSPADAWEYHNRVNRRVTAEFVPFEVKNYVAKVTGEPTSAQLNELYEKHKYEDPNPESPEPGFHSPKRVDFHYFVAQRDKFVQQEKAKVTRQQIEEYYEERKNNFRIHDDFGVVDEVDQNDPRQATPRPPRPRIVEESESDPRGANPVPPAVDDEGPSPDDVDTQPGGCDDESPEASDVGEAGEAGADEVPPSTDAPPATDPPAGADDAKDDLIFNDKPPKEPKYKPLEEVEDDIRSAIAGEMAADRIDEAVRRATQAVKDYEDKRLDFTSGISADPGPFDHQAVAKKLGIGAGETGLVSARTLYDDAELGLGRSSRIVEHTGDVQYFLTVGFSDGLQSYQPIETQVGGREKVFVSWKLAEEKAHVPELKDIRDEVVKAWKTDEARELAQQAAEKLAGEVDGAKSLKGQVPSSLKVLTPKAFSYVDPISMMMVRFGQARMPRLDEIEEIEDNSSDTIKREIVKMQADEVEVLPNAAKSIYYVVRVAADAEDEQDSRRNFIQSIIDNPLGEGPPLEGLMVSGRDLRSRNPIDLQQYFDWYEQLEEEYDVKRVDEEFFRRADREG